MVGRLLPVRGEPVNDLLKNKAAYVSFTFRDLREGVVQQLSHTIAFVKCQKVFRPRMFISRPLLTYSAPDSIFFPGFVSLLGKLGSWEREFAFYRNIERSFEA